MAKSSSTLSASGVVGETQAELCLEPASSDWEGSIEITGVPEKLKQQDPSLKLYVRSSKWTRAAFRGNPFIDGFCLFPTETRQVADLPVPRLYIQPGEKKWIERLLAEKHLPSNRDKLLCAIHPWLDLHHSTAGMEFWDRLVARLSDRFRFWQIGDEGQSAVQGCEYYLLAPSRSARWCRRILALIASADAWIGQPGATGTAALALGAPGAVLLDPAGTLFPGQKAAQEREGLLVIRLTSPDAAAEQLLNFLQTIGNRRPCQPPLNAR